MIRANTLGWGGAVLASALTIAACGGGAGSGGSTTSGTSTATSSASGSGSAPDPCKLISAQEASTALGQDAGTASGNVAQCAYTTAAGSLTVTVTQYPDAGTAGTGFDSVRTVAMQVQGFQDVTGIGERAYMTAGLIGFIKGSVVVSIQLLAPTPTANTMTTLGQAAAGRM